MYDGVLYDVGKPRRGRVGMGVCMLDEFTEGTSRNKEGRKEVKASTSKKE